MTFKIPAGVREVVYLAAVVALAAALTLGVIAPTQIDAITRNVALASGIVASILAYFHVTPDAPAEGTDISE